MLSFTHILRTLATAVFVLAAGASLTAQKVNTSFTGLAIDGYDPVAYFTEHKPVKGRSESLRTVKKATPLRSSTLRSRAA